jgi:hypothetical protein
LHGLRWYTARVDRKAGPTGNASSVWSPGRIRDPASCEKAVAAARRLPPDLPELDRSAAAYNIALRVLAPLLDDVDAYYKQELYKDDHLARGKALHPRLMAAFDAFARADRELRSQLQSIGARSGARLRATEN